jgi:hypothetical protein
MKTIINKNLFLNTNFLNQTIMKTNFLKTKNSLAVLAVVATSLFSNTSIAQVFSTITTGTYQDGYTINDDWTNVGSFFRLQTNTNSAFRLNNQNNNFFISRSTVQNVNDVGTVLFNISDIGNVNIGFGTGPVPEKLSVNGNGYFSGNLALGTGPSGDRLAVNGSTRFAGSPRIDGGFALEFGAGVAKQGDAGKICYGCFDGGASLNIVGAGNSPTNRLVKMWDNAQVVTKLGVGFDPALFSENFVVNGKSRFVGKVFVNFDGVNGFNSANLTKGMYVNGGLVSDDYIMAAVPNWADFVFANDYKLPTLKETEAYILANKHLPNILSAEEVKKNGYSLPEMNRNFLQTIEEMTLHSIAQEKKIEALTNEIAEIKAMLSKK